MSALFAMDSAQRVQFYDCDPMGVVWHGNYLKYLETARGEFLDFIGYGYTRIYDRGHVFPVVEEKIRYLRPLTVGDSFIVRTNLVEYVNRLVHTYELIRGDEVCMRARSVQVCVAAGFHELSFFMPEDFIAAVEAKTGLSESKSVRER